MTTGVDSFRLENVSDFDEPSVYSSGNGSSEDREGDSEGDSQGACAVVPVADAPTPSVPAAEVNRMDHDDRSVDSVAEGEDMSTLGTEGAEDHLASTPGPVAAATGATSATTVATEYSGTDPAKNPGLPAPAAKSNEIPVSIVKFLKEREETERARRNQIILVAVVTTIVVLGVSLGVGLGYKPPSSETPAWLQDGSSTSNQESTSGNSTPLRTRIPVPSTEAPTFTPRPTLAPSFILSQRPSFKAPSAAPSSSPSKEASLRPSVTTLAPTESPLPSPSPSDTPSVSAFPSQAPSTDQPSGAPSILPSISNAPTRTAAPTSSRAPTLKPSSLPSSSPQPSVLPTVVASSFPSTTAQNMNNMGGQMRVRRGV